MSALIWVSDADAVSYQTISVLASRKLDFGIDWIGKHTSGTALRLVDSFLLLQFDLLR